ncbi:MAG TPA: radical SAM protein [Methanocella sp.]|jgi:radical SAM superfamily enzyme YgiQ (UPF0313 family)
MKVMLVNPNSAIDAASSEQAKLPYGILYIASVLERGGHEVRVIDRNLDRRDIDDAIRTFSPQILGLSVMTGPCILDALDISRATKRLDPGIVVVWGGVHSTIFPAMCLAEASIDIVVRREGEQTMLELVNALSNQEDVGGIAGISYKKDGTACHNPERPFIKNLDELPDPAWHLVDVARYTRNRLDGRKYLSMNTTRGCPFRCGFCYNKFFNEFKWRGISAEKVIGQIKYLYENHDIRFIEFLEDNFTVNHKRLEKICDAIIADGLDLQWYCESRVNTLNRDLMTKMKRSGCVGIGFGVESGSPRMLQLITKDITPEQTIRTFDLCRETGIYPDAYVMTGLPHEEAEDFRQTMELLDRIPYRMCDLMVYKPYPGTDLFDLCIAEGLFDPPQTLEGWAEISDIHSAKFSIGHIPEDMIKSAKRKTLMKNRYNNVKRILREVPISKIVRKAPGMLPRFMSDSLLEIRLKRY